uniref:DUF2247 family protein n=1 Tax=Echinostoma caproni TaxID=27848 RepID=A0A183BFK2_9TREM
LIAHERSALSWLANQLYDPRNWDPYSDESLQDTLYSGYLGELIVNVSQPVQVDSFVEAWHKNPGEPNLEY